MITEKNFNIKEIPEIAKKIASIKGVKAVYLFGSYAKMEQHKLSDIDLCVICEKEDADIENKVLSFSYGNLEISFFWKLPLQIRFRVFCEGKILAMNDKNFVDKLKIITLKEYLDLKPLINKYCLERFKCTI